MSEALKNQNESQKTPLEYLESNASFQPSRKNYRRSLALSQWPIFSTFYFYLDNCTNDIDVCI